MNEFLLYDYLKYKMSFRIFFLYQKIDNTTTAKLPYFPSMKVDTARWREETWLGAESDLSLPGISLILTMAENEKLLSGERSHLNLNG